MCSYISMAVNILSHRNEKQREKDQNAIKGAIKYIKATRKLTSFISK